MGTLKRLRRRIARLWVRRHVREIALAVILTFAAAGFLTVAMWRGDFSHEKDKPYAAARKAP